MNDLRSSTQFAIAVPETMKKVFVTIIHERCLLIYKARCACFLRSIDAFKECKC
ncbi:MAG: hypothetical protein KME38_23225 [Spirirestis rafaelensis WJT71-NPBG6]|jgi:hypothetical protein|nr:hypothetical protein [Spirirestis rafaelensis WJT71-NPBG6]